MKWQEGKTDMIFSNQQDNEMEHLNKRIQTVAVLAPVQWAAI